MMMMIIVIITNSRRMQQWKPNAADEGWKISIPKIPKQLSGESGLSLDDSNSS